jgi:LPXTG-motif cell wall-anchored protein
VAEVLSTLALAAGFTVVGEPTAFAGVALAVPPDVPGNLIVGQSVNSSVTVIYGNSGGDQADPDTITAITLVPSCGKLTTTADCPTSFEDPDVLIPRGPFVGANGTACAGQTFTISQIDPVQGKYLFTPVGGATVVLDPVSPANRCQIDFVTDVYKMPTRDSNSTIAGIQTAQTASADARSSANVTGSGTGADEANVAPGVVPIVTAVQPATIEIGSPFHDSATMSPSPHAAPPTGTIRFDVYDNQTCTGPPVFTSTNPLNAAGTAATSDDFVPTKLVTYSVVATYSGDLNYASNSTPCNDPPENVNVVAVSTTTTVAPTTTVASETSTTVQPIVRPPMTTVTVPPPDFNTTISLPATGATHDTELWTAVIASVAGVALVLTARRRRRPAAPSP